jgi:nuclear protein localization protein 4 homolog
VDNIEFENGQIVNDFLNFWRTSSHQRIGFLVGRYEPFTEVPLGIKAVICAIYEPPQRSTGNSVALENDPNEAKVDQLCGWLGLKRVGWIFTDLWSDNPKLGTVHYIRNEVFLSQITQNDAFLNQDSFLITAAECITAGHFQSNYKNYTQYCADQFFGSKFVTVVASGNQEKHIDFHGYQVSNQCTAMVEANILCPTKTHPELAWARENPLNETHYITDVQYTVVSEHLQSSGINSLLFSGERRIRPGSAQKWASYAGGVFACGCAMWAQKTSKTHFRRTAIR